MIKYSFRKEYLSMLPYKDDNPTSIFPYVTVGLIVLNVVAFFLQLGVGQEVFYRYGAIPALLLGDGAGPPQPIAAGGTVLTSMFMHGGLLHLGGNMLYLWIFGNNIEDALGHGRFAVFYILG
ncbi:rhomboid family intramembrane serine protease, partial [bacterium]|nr:rhomboid family intramembrane serine protease [bacterium]